MGLPFSARTGIKNKKKGGGEACLGQKLSALKQNTHISIAIEEGS